MLAVNRATGGREATMGPGGGAAGAAAGTTGPFARTRLSTWAPRRRTHLLCAACAGLLAYFSIVSMYPLRPEWTMFEVAGSLGVALVSVWPLGGAALSLLAACTFHVVAQEAGGPPLPLLAPWLCASVLLTRGFHRAAAYGTVALSAVAGFVTSRLGPAVGGNDDSTVPMTILGCGCLVVAELMRRPREAADAAAERYQADLERQRLLVVSELHDTVVRDLTQAVMTAEQARLARPDAVLAPDLTALTASVRTAVEQLRTNLRAISGAAGAIAGTAGKDGAAGAIAGTAGKDGAAGATAGTAGKDSAAGAGAVGLDVLASSAPRPLAEVVAEVRAVLAGRGIALETGGLELLESYAVPPGVRQQLVRVLGELASNMASHAAPGSARIAVESDGRALRALAANAVRSVAPEAGGAGDPAIAGLGLTGARRRVESLGGAFEVRRARGRWTVVLSVPLRAAP
ncbi:sensor histidine kinase [Actinomyces israelii]|uniref:ATP-binding protein n=1 Tax=Actinomyces israelii TaxID=1659 RepID=UPI002552B349|nr:ATP-binding protein [Actinomyces israelii]